MAQSVASCLGPRSENRHGAAGRLGGDFTILQHRVFLALGRPLTYELQEGFHVWLAEPPAVCRCKLGMARRVTAAVLAKQEARMGRRRRDRGGRDLRTERPYIPSLTGHAASAAPEPMGPRALAGTKPSTRGSPASSCTLHTRGQDCKAIVTIPVHGSLATQTAQLPCARSRAGSCGGGPRSWHSQPQRGSRALLLHAGLPADTRQCTFQALYPACSACNGPCRDPGGSRRWGLASSMESLQTLLLKASSSCASEPGRSTCSQKKLHGLSGIFSSSI